MRLQQKVLCKCHADILYNDVDALSKCIASRSLTSCFPSLLLCNTFGNDMNKIKTPFCYIMIKKYKEGKNTNKRNENDLKRPTITPPRSPAS